MVLRRPDALHGQAPASPRHPCQREAPRLRAFCHGGQVAIPGVTHLGRLSHAAVADQFRRARIWAYPCSFRETSCITAMKARAGGAIPAVIPNGALRETVRFGFRTGRDFDNPGGPAVTAWWTNGGTASSSCWRALTGNRASAASWSPRAGRHSTGRTSPRPGTVNSASRDTGARRGVSQRRGPKAAANSAQPHRLVLDLTTSQCELLSCPPTRPAAASPAVPWPPRPGRPVVGPGQAGR